VLLSRQRDRMSGALMARIKSRRGRVAGFRARLDEGAQAEDDDWAFPVAPGSGPDGDGGDEVAMVAGEPGTGGDLGDS
jgi:hypothetical protein